MVIGYINSKWSMPRRLALISAVFLLPSLIQLYMYAENKLSQAALIDKEIEGSKLAGAIWASLATDGSSEIRSFSNNGGKVFGLENQLAEFDAAKTNADKARVAIDLLDAVGDASAMTLDPSIDTYHAQDLLLQRLPQVNVALAGLRNTLSAGASPDAAIAMDYRALADATEEIRKPVQDLFVDDASGYAKRTIGASSTKLIAELEDIKAKVKAANFQRQQLAADLEPLLVNASRTTNEVARDVNDTFAHLADLHAGNARFALYVILALLIGATIVAAVFVAMLSKGVTLRLSNLVRAMDQLSRKELTVEVPCLGDSNENGQIAQALSRFKEALIENKAMTDAAVEGSKQQQEMSDHYAKEHERFMEAFTGAADRIASGKFSQHIEQKVISEYEPITNQMNLMMDQLEEAQVAKASAETNINVVVDALGKALSELAEGHLEVTVDADVAPEFAKLKADFNSAAQQLRNTIELVKKGASSIKLGTDEIAQASDDLSRRTENQAASLEETAAAVKEITDTVNKTARGATHARETVSVAKADAEKGGEVVRKAIEAMNGIENSSRQISQIIGVIDEIAFQTNLLALNAGVEAARAGDAGRGFAVVASEVRALAQRSAEAAKEIKSLISASTGQVSQGVQLVGETGQALTRIVTQVAEINGIVTSIAASATEQAHGLEQVNTAVNEMDQVTQQNAAMVEEATAATQTLAQQTEELAHLVSRFRTGNDSVVDMSSRREAKAAHARPAAKVKVAASAGAPRKAAAAAAPAADAGWEEF